MASASSSCDHKSFTYDVFLSFRGEDTRTNFTDHLYYALEHKGIHTYRDSERIKKGKRISDELIGSIQDSKFHIIVFSKNYASSSWCLDELVKIMECHQTNEHTAYPVFYDVEPSHVRKQSGAVEEAFAKHENNEAAGKWREALKQAADLAGWELKNTADGHEAKFIQKIVEELSLELRAINFSTDEKLVGMETRIKDVISVLGTGFDDVRMIGIRGMGGGGKTTLARAVFDQISFQFEGKSFVENVREVSNTSLSGLKSLQHQVLSDVLDDQAINIKSVHDGKHMLKRRMRGRKVFVVLDDVDHIDQLEALAGEANWFKPGSRIIITTRDQQVLVAHRVKLILDVNLLSNKEAICLFSRYAFGRDIPLQGYEELSKQVVLYASGLPLTIRVLGSFLCSKNEREWIDALARLKTIPLKETLKILELSYIGLEEDYKEIFLDIACILKGWPNQLAIEALESCGFHARNGLRVLEQKSLITISHDNPRSYDVRSHDVASLDARHFSGYVGMHDHIEEMGKNIVRRSHPDNPNKHSRLWIEDEVKDILANDLGSEATRFIQSFKWKVNPDIVVKGLRKMKDLRFLFVDLQVSFHNNEVSPYFSDALQYVHWCNYPFRSLPETFQGNNLVALKMARSIIVQLWEGGERKVLNKLRFLDLSHSKLKTLDLGLTPNLEMLNLRGCCALLELHMPVACRKLRSFHLSGSKLRSLDLGSVPNLELLDLYECWELLELYMSKRSHPRTLDLRLNPNLEYLSVTNCYDLEEIHMADECQKLTSIDINNSKLRILSLGVTPNLKHLGFRKCFDLEELRMASECPKISSLDFNDSKLRTLSLRLTPNLEYLGLKNCFHLEELYMPDESQKLASLCISQSKLRSLDLGLAPNLKKLDLGSCFDLEELYMPDECQKLASLCISHSKLRSLDLGLTPNLEKLDLRSCFDLEELHMAGECQKLTYLFLGHLKLRTFDLGLTPNLEKLYLDECSNLVELHAPIGCLKELVYLDISGCLRFGSFFFHIKDDTTSCRVDESREVGPLAELHLIVESLPNCRVHLGNSLPEFQFTCYYNEDRPSLTGNLENLISCGLCACTNLERFSRSICALRSLKKLKLEGSIPEAPKDLDQLECLEELSLLSTNIKHLPDSICMLKHMKSLKLKTCCLLEKLPKDLGRLESLEKLTLSSTIIKHLPDSICMLKHLKLLKLKFCWLLETLPEDLGRLECLKKLTLSSAKIKHLPDSICMLKQLRSLKLEFCWLLEKLPEDLGQLECLEKLTLSSTKIERLPYSICMLEHLKYLELNNDLLLEKLPEDLG